MLPTKFITGNTEDEVWQQVTTDLTSDEDIFEYVATISQGDKRITVDIDVDPGGGFEGGYELTTLSASLKPENDFRFAIHHEDFLDDIGKFFGMEDVKLGYPEFDKKVIVKTNNADKVKPIFSDASLREFFAGLEDYTLSVTHEKNDAGTEIPFLKLSVEQGYTNPAELRKLYRAFYQLLSKLED